MFSQMRQAVAVCHAVNIFHRDISFIVTDGWVKSPDDMQERKVVVKLTDFGLSTNDVESGLRVCAVYELWYVSSDASTLLFTKPSGITLLGYRVQE